jgi:hypothetical protein
MFAETKIRLNNCSAVEKVKESMNGIQKAFNDEIQL